MTTAVAAPSPGAHCRTLSTFCSKMVAIKLLVLEIPVTLDSILESLLAEYHWAIKYPTKLRKNGTDANAAAAVSGVVVMPTARVTSTRATVRGRASNMPLITVFPCIACVPKALEITLFVSNKRSTAAILPAII